ncbi:primosomal protein N' [Bacillus subtilis]|jgi:primosomal protein N' (replication factor Y)|uniref:Replication restart protein PriA n=3 Tax=Bacillus subtilis subsp. subtilis TaxID=135461 RepID=PRIA_BACSU|nr:MULTISPECIES: primosomal protein N' [Bacillales]NP_389453.1 primosomal replication factor Y (primosomal protein N') [Bacillus subtilis subsp. subtilis str. 168]P94461.2 RecName: Full=Primosomal protein N'; AltName: Full=ATP-dependent helicase PriA [Bacillus subtilis subsp. subtilis str. 168]MBL3638150.1 primosomal protein N' [Alkalicoccobacillus gibsonii]MDP4100552.1 primosomal protein N' [Bacillota bacterium]BAM52218.1 primosome assembly protein PriA [Bacillus subtilis BEST7613]ADV96597.1
MNFAEVIVDVSTKNIDRPFDYKIPDHLKGMIKTGMRVIVPFGPRKIQGFVTAVKEASDLSGKSVKEVEDLLDLTPVLTEELMILSSWLSDKTLSFKITALQAMLPAALKAKYEKELKIAHGADLPPQVERLFSETKTLLYSDIPDHETLKLIQRHVQKGDIDVTYKVAQKTNKKMVRHIQANASKEELAKQAEGLSRQAAKQQAILHFLISEPEGVKIPAAELCKKTDTSSATIKTLIQKGLLKESYEEVYRDPYQDKMFKKTEPLPLTDEQRAAFEPIRETLDSDEHKVFLLHGVTGSGKTEIYLQSIEKVLAKGKEAIVLVPEISLTPQMVNRFKGRFGSQVAVMHSGLSTGEKYDEWRKIHRKEVRLVVGARSAIFAPFENLGMIIIDEEHESSYKQEEMPRYHAKEVAIKRAEHHSCPVVLGSATPTLESYARAQKGVYELLSLKHRVNHRVMPEVSLVDMREELRNGNRSMFSVELMEKLEETIAKGEQAVLFLNKRGYSSFVMCRDCGYVPQCPHCDISMTYHRYGQRLKCHYCGHEEPVPHTCPECASEHIRFFGTGTQRVEEELTKVLPSARVIRMDVDTTSRKGAHEKLLSAFGEGKADILLGTQMIAKGLDFPNVTLVGVLSADTTLHIPDFRSAEKTFQLLTQVSGRAGRHEKPGHVIIQTYTPSHYSIQLTKTHDYETFYQHEMAHRREQSYPPYYYLALVTVSHEEVAKAAVTAEKIAHFLKANCGADTKILGPSASPIARIKDRYRYQCVIKYKQETQLSALLKKILEHYKREIEQKHVMISIDMNPYMMM